MLNHTFRSLLGYFFDKKIFYSKERSFFIKILIYLFDFELDKPKTQVITESIYEYSYQNNFAHRLLQVAKAFECFEDGYEKFNCLSDKQKQSIYFFLAKSKKNHDITYGKALFHNETNIHVTNKKQAQAIKAYLFSLQSMAQIAEAFLFYNSKEAIQAYKKLDPFIQKQIDQILWRLEGKTFKNMKKDLQKNDEETSKLIAKAFMKFISELIII